MLSIDGKRVSFYDRKTGQRIDDDQLISDNQHHTSISSRVLIDQVPSIVIDRSASLNSLNERILHLYYYQMKLEQLLINHRAIIIHNQSNILPRNHWYECRTNQFHIHCRLNNQQLMTIGDGKQKQQQIIDQKLQQLHRLAQIYAILFDD